ncbi:MAG: hypothetical protein HQL41_01400 [Alphaproteobacteria bacterium]|nr:hypothetical protein [Alphaproteobacteria bacterium]
MIKDIGFEKTSGWGNTKVTKDTKGAAIRRYSPAPLVTLGVLGALVVKLF